MVGSAKQSGWIVPLLVFGSCVSLSVLLWKELGGAGQLALELLLSSALGLTVFLHFRNAARLRDARWSSASVKRRSFPMNPSRTTRSSIWSPKGCWSHEKMDGS